MSVTITPMLRNTLLADAAASGAAGLLMAAGAGFLAPLLGLPQPLLFWAGLVLLPWTALLVVLARRQMMPRLFLVDVVATNLLWAAASFGILVSGLVSPNLLGIAFVSAQALAVAGFALLQMQGLRPARLKV